MGHARCDHQAIPATPTDAWPDRRREGASGRRRQPTPGASGDTDAGGVGGVATRRCRAASGDMTRIGGRLGHPARCPLVEGAGLGAGAGEFARAIRTAWLHVSPRFHLRPIDVVVFHGSRRDLVLRWVSRLDAFSGYPFRT